MNDEAIARLREAVRVFDLDSIEHDPIVSFDDLRALLDAHDAARADGVAAERARVVAWLRCESRAAPVKGREFNSMCRLADAIERGKHEEDGNG